MNQQLTIGWLYPELMSTYGDRGNIIVLKKQCEWRGIRIKIEEITLETSISFLKKCDLIFMGGAQDRQQKLAGPDLIENKGPIMKELIERNVPALFVCAAIQAVGRYYRPYVGNDIPGAGIFDLTTKHPGDQAKRLIGNTVASVLNPSELAGQMIVGFENHGGKTHLGPKLKPFARVKHGFGNNGEDSYEGAVYKNAIGSYFHGPLLTKNPSIARWLIKKALEVKYRKEVELERLDEALENKARENILSKLNI